MLRLVGDIRWSLVYGHLLALGGYLIRQRTGDVQTVTVGHGDRDSR